MINSLTRFIRDWRSRSSLKKCAAASYAALQHADQTLAAVEEKGTKFIEEIQHAANNSSQDGPTLQQARSTLRDRSQQLTFNLQREIGDLRTALLGKRWRSGRFTVALFGRTMAGKSTIREAITGGDGSTIGKGGQRTTRELREYAWKGLSIVDTPGFGAYEGAVDRECAFSVVDDSDVIVFLLSSDGVQEEAFREMAALNRLRKNVVFVLNVKQDLTKISKYRRDFLCEPKAWLGDAAIQSHRNRIESLIKEHAPWMISQIRLVAVHAQAAYLAQLPEYRHEAKDLHAASNLRELLHLLEDELHERGTERRIQTIAGGTERALAFMADHLAAVGRDFEKEVKLLEEKHCELTKSLHEFSERFPDRCRDAVAEHFAPVLRDLGSFVEENLREKDFKERWCSRLAELNTEQWGRKFTIEIAEEVSAKVAEFWRQVRCDAEFFHQQDATGVDHADTTDWQKVVRRIGMGVGVVALAVAVAAYFSTPPGWVTAAIAVVGTATAMLSSLIPKGKEWKRAVEEARQKLDAEIASHSRNLDASIREWFAKEIERGLIAPLHQDVNGLCQSIHALSEAATKLVVGLNSCRDQLMSHYPEHFRTSTNSDSNLS